MKVKVITTKMLEDEKIIEVDNDTALKVLSQLESIRTFDDSIPDWVYEKAEEEIEDTTGKSFGNDTDMYSSKGTITRVETNDGVTLLEY